MTLSTTNTRLFINGEEISPVRDLTEDHNRRRLDWSPRGERRVQGRGLAMTDSERIIRRATGRALNWMERAKAWADAVFTDRADYSVMQERLLLGEGRLAVEELRTALFDSVAGEDHVAGVRAYDDAHSLLHGWIRPQKSVAPGPRLGWMMKPTPEPTATIALPIHAEQLAGVVVRRYKHWGYCEACGATCAGDETLVHISPCPVGEMRGEDMIKAEPGDGPAEQWPMVKPQR